MENQARETGNSFSGFDSPKEIIPIKDLHAEEEFDNSLKQMNCKIAKQEITSQINNHTTKNNEEMDWIDFLRNQNDPDTAVMKWEDFLRLGPPREQQVNWYESLKTEKPKKQLIDWVEFLRTENPTDYQTCKQKLMDWLEFLRTEPKDASSSNLVRWQDFLRQESPDELNRAIHWREFLRTSEPHKTNKKATRNNQLQIESLRTPRAKKPVVQALPLPDELIIHILSILDVWSVGNFSATCKHAQTLFHDALLWKIIYFREYRKHPLSSDSDGDSEYWQKLCKNELPYVGKEWIAWSKKEKDPVNVRGGILSSLKKSLTKKKEMRVFLFGLENSGKSSVIKSLPKAILRQQNTDFLQPQIPTRGCNYEAIAYKETVFHFLDVGGVHTKTQYEKYAKTFDYIDACGLVVDASNLVELVLVRKLIDFIVKHPVLAKKPLIVFANKKDQSHSLYGTSIILFASNRKAVVDIICDVLNRFKEAFKEWYLQTCSCKTGDGLLFALEWLSEVAKD